MITVLDLHRVWIWDLELGDFSLLYGVPLKQVPILLDPSAPSMTAQKRVLQFWGDG